MAKKSLVNRNKKRIKISTLHKVKRDELKRIIKDSIITTYCSKKDIIQMEDYYGKINKSF